LLLSRRSSCALYSYIVMTIDYKNIILILFYIAFCCVLLLLLLLSSLLSVHPEITSLHARTHGGHARYRATGGCGYTGRGAGHPSNDRDRRQAQNKYHHGPRCLLKKQYQFRLAIHGRVWIIRPLSALTRARLSRVLAERYIYYIILYMMAGEADRKGVRTILYYYNYLGETVMFYARRSACITINNIIIYLLLNYFVQSNT